MDDKHDDAREHFFAAIRILACSADTIQTRLIEANESILRVAINEFDGDAEMKIKFARILDLLAVDQDEIEIVAQQTAAHMTDLEASAVAHLVCDLYFDLGG
jgi:deoxyribose-phosphate aldolase